MSVLAWFRSFSFVILILIQSAAWFHLYGMHKELLARINQNNDEDSLGMSIGRERRAIRSSEEPNEELVQNRSKLLRPHKVYLLNMESTTTSPVIVRPSRTKNISPSRKLRHRKCQDIQQRKTLMKNEQIEIFDGSIEIGTKNKHNSENELLDVEIISEELKTTTTRPIFRSFPPAIIHFMSDTHNYSTVKHPHYSGNGRIKVSGVFTDWKPAPWTHSLGSNGHFKMDQGKLTIYEPGVYLFYAQIHYANIQEMNGYKVYHNNQVVAQCSSTTAHPDRNEVKSNTCSLSTLLDVAKGDTLWLHDVHQDRYVILTPSKSYFGLVLLYQY